MKRSGFYGSLVAILVSFFMPCSIAAESPTKTLAGRPYYSFFAASIERLFAVCESVFESVDRPDLAKTMSERLKSYRNFAGIDRARSLGMMSVWNQSGSADIVFLPVDDIDELMKTATFGVLGYHSTGPDRYVIERPVSPYNVLVKNKCALFADSISTIQALQVTPEQLSRGLRDRYDVVLLLDLKQIPRSLKSAFVNDLRSQTEPWLQPQDDEAAETGNLRKMVGKLALELCERLVLDTDSVTIGARLDPKTRHILFELSIEAAPASPMASALNRLVSRRNEFTSLVSPDVPAGVALNLPLSGLVDQVLGQGTDPAARGKSLEAGLQVAGSEFGKLSLLAALRGEEAIQLNAAIPDLVMKLEKSGNFTEVRENVDVYEGIAFHSIIPRELPEVITNLVGHDLEIIIGQGKQIVWLAIGNPDTLSDRLCDAIDRVDQPGSPQKMGALVRARFQAKQLPELAASDLLAPNVDRETTRAAFAEGNDGFTISLEPMSNGIKLRVEAEEGFVRLIGRDWVQQVEDSRR